MNKKLLEEVMKGNGDKCKDLASALGMSAQNFSTIWSGRGEFSLKYIRIIAEHYGLGPEEIYDIFIFPQG